MAGYLAPSGTKTEGVSYDALLYCKTNIAGYFFDGFIKVQHEHNLKITENPVETGASVVDHAYLEPAELTMDIIVSDVHQSYVSGQFEEGDSVFRHINAWNVLRKLQEDRIPVSVFTKLQLYDNMLIKSLSAVDMDETFRALSCSVVLRGIPIARVRTVKISKAPQTTTETESGTLEAETVPSRDQSALDMILGGLKKSYGGGS